MAKTQWLPSYKTKYYSLISTQVWMLTGDKLETATCTAKNAHLVTRNQDIHIFRPVSAAGDPLFLLHAYEVANS